MRLTKVTDVAPKQFADTLTILRVGFAFALTWLGLAQGAAGLPIAVWIMIADWTGDCLDGPIARRDRRYHHTWIGDHDLEADMLVAGGLLVYMFLAGHVDPWWIGLYLLAWALMFVRGGIPRALGMLFQAPIYGWFIIIAIRDAPDAGWWLVAWIAVAAVVTWPKFPQEVVPGFLSGMRRALRPRLPPRG
jgi:hypothetical protein